MISVLCPSRGRPERALVSYESFYGQDIEFLVAVDKDDPRLNEYEATRLDLTICPRFRYSNLEMYYNLLAKKAKGDWLLNWNDDSYLDTRKDDEFTESDNIEALLDADPSEPYIAVYANLTSFPLMSRGMYKLLGHFSAGPSTDSYLMAIGQGSGRLIYRDLINVSHERDTIKDGTNNEREAEFPVVDARMESKFVVEQRYRDIERIRNAT